MKSLRIICASLCALLAAGCAHSPEWTLQEVGTGFAATSVNTCVFRTSPIASDSNCRVVAYYDEDSRVTIGIQKRGSKDWAVTHTPFTGNTADAHDVISIALDGDGYIHMSFNQHNVPLKYCRSTEPYSAEFTELLPMTGDDEQRVTYPQFFRLSDGGLLFFYRSGKSGNGNLVLNRYDLESRTWTCVQDNLIDGEGLRNAYPQMFVDSRDRIHLSWVWRESYLVETNHDLCYAFSDDAGLTWHRSDGTDYQMPINCSSAEYAWYVPQGSELINQTSMTADSDGHPYIATYWRDEDAEVPQYRLVWHDGKQWNSIQLGEREEAFSLSGGGTKAIPIARPQLAMGPSGEAYYIFRDEERGSKVSMYYSRRIGSADWQVLDLTDFSVGSWEPSLDVEALKRGEVSVFVQNSVQGDGEQKTETPAQKVYVLDLDSQF